MYSGETLTERGRATLRLPAWALGEQRLARMAARGERHAFEALFTRYHRELYHYCRAIVGEPEEAHDALQNTMAVALGHLPKVERRTSLRGWLYRVAHNEAVSILRRRPAPVDPVDLPEAMGLARTFALRSASDCASSSSTCARFPPGSAARS
jgi:DNA-directed RNA polymerase specialized sigma24 family protein